MSIPASTFQPTRQLLDHLARPTEPRTSFGQFRCATLAIACLCVASGFSTAEEIVEFRSISDLPTSQVSPKVTDGEEAVIADWPATFYAEIELPTGTFPCTATLIGHHTLLTAAHCVPKNGTINITRKGKKINATCTHSSHYDPKKPCTSADYAFCKLDEKFVNVAPEPISKDVTKLRKGKKILLAGYGCTSIGGASNGLLYVARAPLTADFSANDTPSGHAYTEGSHGICPGDSGGLAYWTETADTVKARAGIAINSCFNSTLKPGAGISIISTLYVTASKEFIKSAELWSNGDKTAINWYEE